MSVIHVIKKGFVSFLWTEINWYKPIIEPPNPRNNRIIGRISQLPPPTITPFIDFTSPDLWTEATQKIIDNFRLNLQQWTVSFCPTCLKTHPFSRCSQIAECNSCKTRKNKRKSPLYGVQNDMDPGVVRLFHSYNSSNRRFQMSCRISLSWKKC
jgi:hypothetical protein